MSVKQRKPVKILSSVSYERLTHPETKSRHVSLQPFVATIRIKLSDLDLTIEGRSAVSLNAEDVIEQLRFLPKPSHIEIEGDEAILHFPETSDKNKEEAERLAKRAGSRAQEGQYDKAIGILKRALELDPLLHTARRDLAMVFVEMGKTDDAINHLIEVLRLNPSDAWSWVVLANLFINQKKDPDTGRRFLERALALNPNDPWALTSLGAVAAQQGDLTKAIGIFEKAIEANPTVANPYLGLAMVLSKDGKIESASEVLTAMFRSAHEQDVRTARIFEQAHDLFASLQEELARRNQDRAEQIIKEYAHEIERTSGFPVRFATSDFEDTQGVKASIQMAWKKGRNYHVLETSKTYPPHLLPAIQAHELSHIKFEVSARLAGTNKWFTTSAITKANAERSLSSDLNRLKREFDQDVVRKVTDTLIAGLTSFLYNVFLDMMIEKEIRARFPLLRPAQILSTSIMAREARESTLHPTIRKITPRKILNASLVLNGVYSLFLDDLFEGATEFAKAYHTEETFAMSHRIFNHCMMRLPNLSAGEEYDVIDEIAEMLDLTGWYEWKIDTGSSDSESDDRPESGGVTNPSLLEAKSPASVAYLVSVLKRFQMLNTEEIKEIGFEIAMLGQHGLDYTNAHDRYNLRTIPGEKFTGLQLMCLMFLAFKVIDSGLDTGIDLAKEYEMAKRIYEEGQ